MADDEPYATGSETHAQAQERVDSASAKRSQLREEQNRAKGTGAELQANAALRAANDEVTARKRWLQSVEDGEY